MTPRRHSTVRSARGQAAVEWLLVAAAIFVLTTMVVNYGNEILWYLFYRTAAIIAAPFG